MLVASPDEICGIESGTSRSTALVGQRHGADQRSPTQRRRDELWIDRGQHELRPSAHLEEAVLDSPHVR